LFPTLYVGTLNAPYHEIGGPDLETCKLFFFATARRREGTLQKNLRRLRKKNLEACTSKPLTSATAWKAGLAALAKAKG